MRLFVALVPPPAVLDDLGRLQSDLRAVTPEELGLHWTTTDQWHVTLTFLGDVQDRQLDELTTRLARAATRHEPMRLQVAHGGGFGSSKAARVLWAGIESTTTPGDTKPLRRLAESTTAAARRSGLDVREGHFRPHLTLARRKHPGDVRALVDRLEEYNGPAWHADRIELVRSHLGQGEGRRSRYETIAGWPLGKPASTDQR